MFKNFQDLNKKTFVAHKNQQILMKVNSKQFTRASSKASKVNSNSLKAIVILEVEELN